MIKGDFLSSVHVKGFITWIQQKLDTSGSFNHQYNKKKPAIHWSCNSIYSAFENYNWRFSTTDPINGKKVTGSTFYDSAESLSKLSLVLKKSVEVKDCDLCAKCCLSILEWGGVRNKNDKRVEELGNSICEYFNKAQEFLSNGSTCTEYKDGSILMNSGFTKIYSLLIDGFVIYDGRVGAALGLLVRKYCEDQMLEGVPDELAFAWSKGKESRYTSSDMNKRNPSRGKYKFPELLNNPKRHIDNNIKANWLLKEIIQRTDSRFNRLDKGIQLRALEAALFMIGYDVSEIG